MKRPQPIKKVSAESHVLRFPVATERPVKAHCLNCSLPLSLSQPDLHSPGRLLGVCPQCKRWFFIHLILNQTEGFLWRLPDIDRIRQLFFDDPAAESAR
jgi:hypothetical protein